MSEIFEIASNVSTPIGLAGITIVSLYFIFRLVLKLDIFPKLTRTLTQEIILSIINKIFWLSMVATILGFVGYIVTSQTNSSSTQKGKPSESNSLSKANDDDRNTATQVETNVTINDNSDVHLTNWLSQRVSDCCDLNIQITNTGSIQKKLANSRPYFSGGQITISVNGQGLSPIGLKKIGEHEPMNEQHIIKELTAIIQNESKKALSNLNFEKYCENGCDQ